MTTLLAVDWGTTSLRAHRVVDGVVVETRSSSDGILTVAADGWQDALNRHIGDWRREEGAATVLSGMVGSRQGWHEVAYQPLPADAHALAAGAVMIDAATAEAEWGPVRILPGLCHRDPADVMRGEEVQVLGALGALHRQSGRFCLPGTHSKWVDVDGGRIIGFRTHMTGEVYAALKGHTILGRLMVGEADDTAGFAAGVAQSASTAGLLADLFGVRARGLLGELPETGLAAYLSGLLIGHELRSAMATASTAEPIVLVGAQTLVERYRRAAELLGLVTHSAPETAAALGVWQVALAGGWL
ncbi:MAG: 2-dehydro-3-deoxygalactonokinase [Alphaproteobacteria bacterium]|nr:MAG: 2-dehydro-3-deoxygalactonokinase [Alphaproteobacteria bacterium]